MTPTEIPAYLHAERQKRWEEIEQLGNNAAAIRARARIDAMHADGKVKGPDRDLAIEDMTLILGAKGESGERIRFAEGAVMPVEVVNRFVDDVKLVFVQSMEAFVRLGRQIMDPSLMTGDPRLGDWMKTPRRVRLAGWRCVVHAVHGRIIVFVGGKV